MSLVRVRPKSAALSAVASTLAPAAVALAALSVFAAGCKDDHPSGPSSSASSIASSVPGQPASAQASAASPPSEGMMDAAAPPDASPLGDALPALSASAPPPEKTAAPKASASASAKPSAVPAVKSPKEGAADAGAADASVASTKPGTPAPPEDKPADLPPPVAGSPDAIAAQIDAVYVGNKTFSARFKQEFTQKVSGVVKKSTGTLFVEKPNKISFRYDPPNKNRIVSDGNELKIYVAEDSQMFVQPVAKTEYPGALAFLMGNGIRPSFTFTLNDKAKFDGGPVLLGKPRSPTPHYEYVMFYVEKALLDKADPNVVRRVLIVDAQGNKNRFDFEGATQPKSIDPGEFVFAPPPGTTITSDAKK